MDRDEALNLLKGGTDGVEKWNRWRQSGDGIRSLSLSGADLNGADLRGADFSETDLRGADLHGANLYEVNLGGAILVEANLNAAELGDANLIGADLRLAFLDGTQLFEAKLVEADLSQAKLRRADLRMADLSRADLSKTDLGLADLSQAKVIEADLSQADLFEVNLQDAKINRATLFEANLSEVNLCRADLTGANLSRARLSEVDFSFANLFEANLSGAIVTATNFRDAYLSGANLDGAACYQLILADVDLSDVKRLDSISHRGPSTIGIDTILRSGGKIPDDFLRGCGVPEYLIENQKALIGSLEPIQFYSCFISYSTMDEEFAKRLHSKMREAGLRVWFAPENMQAGKKIHEQVDEAIRVFDKLLLVISTNSIDSKWVRDEIRRARKSEIREGRRKLFPVRIMDYKPIEQWQSFYADLAEDVAEEIREYFIPDFSNWKDHDSFELAFARLLRDLKSDESTAQMIR